MQTVAQEMEAWIANTGEHSEEYIEAFRRLMAEEAE